MPKGDNPNSLANLKPWKPGESGNGHLTLGASIKEWLNMFADMQLGAEKLREFARDEKAPATKRFAAVRMLRMIEHPDMADFEPVLDGQMSLRELRNAGINTAVVKKTKTKTKTTPGRDGAPPTVEVEREIELVDRSLEEGRFGTEATDGRPGQSEESADKDPARLLVSITITNGQPTLKTEAPQVHVNSFDALALPSREPLSPETPKIEGNP